ncbi:MAG TPA: Uma2 family endonuclease [Hyphomicrobiaceae bacterium]|jgi:Uma2 family endonuclease
MTARTRLAPEDQMTIEEFLAFTDTRPDEERWELIEGEPVMSPSPVEYHQVVVLNIGSYLMAHQERTGASWQPLLGVGTRVPLSPRSLPQPDVFVKEGLATDRAVTDDALVIFEVLSRSNTAADQAWRRKVYASVPNCQHYVTVSLKVVQVVAYDRDTGWKKHTVTRLAEALALPAIGVSMPLTAIYRGTPLAPRRE